MKTMIPGGALAEPHRTAADILVDADRIGVAPELLLDFERAVTAVNSRRSSWPAWADEAIAFERERSICFYGSFGSVVIGASIIYEDKTIEARTEGLMFTLDGIEYGGVPEAKALTANIEAAIDAVRNAGIAA